MSELPAGTVTFLFTDLEGSTRLWQEHAEAMKTASARHDEIVREAIEDHAGYVVKTTGDGFHAAFGAAHDAIDAAVAAQLALGQEPWGAMGSLVVRMGIHSGPADLREGDYYGTAVNRAARLMGVAHGGQIVVSLATEELVQDGTVELVDLGEHSLRDLARPERVFQVVHPELERDFERLRSLDSFAGNLPVQLTSFVGRDDDLVRIVKLFDEASLVTLIGTGGVGKTRLAIQVAAEVVPGFADGAWFCELAPADDDDAMAQTVASTLGCVQRPGLSLVDSIVEYVKVRELLLVLDNCEHLLDEVGALADAVLRTCPGVKILATSREALDTPGERVVRVRSLDAPEPSATGVELLTAAAVRLFADRAADAGATATWNDAQWAAVGEICRRVDGIPLAIELAAARVASMSPTEIAAHLDERFRLLTGKRRGRVERHQTLRATVEWSYQLLDDDDRAVFDRLGVFAGTFDATGASAVAADDDLDSWQVVDSIASLVAKSMLVAEEGPDDTTRYGMLETLRQFARERLEEEGDGDRWRRRHAEHYVMFADSVGPGYQGPDVLLWLARLRAELDNVRTAVGWALDREGVAERELAVCIAAGLALPARSAGIIGLADIVAQTVSAAEACRPELRSPILTVASNHEMHQGHTDRARELAREALRDGVVATSLTPTGPYQSLSFVEMFTGNYEGALATLNEARTALTTVDNRYDEGLLLGQLAMFEALAGRIDDARVDAERALELAGRLQSPSVLAAALHATAWAWQRDDPAAALAAAEQYLDLCREGFTSLSDGGLLSLAGGLRTRLGDTLGALELLREAVMWSRDQGALPQAAAALDWSLSPLVKTGRPEPAAVFVGALTGGPLAEVAKFPGTEEGRTRVLERVRAALGDETTDALVAQGAAMTFDEIVAYALLHLDAEPE